MKEKVLFPHCEKTGGSTVIRAIAEHENRKGIRNQTEEFMWFPQWGEFYPISAIPISNSDKITDDIKMNYRPYLPIVYRLFFEVVMKMSKSQAVKLPEISNKKHKLLHGHFTLDNIRNYIELPDYKIITIVREPLKRMVSHFQHFERVGWYQIPTFRQVFQKPDNPKTFLDFAFHPVMKNYQSQYFYEFPIESIDALLTTDNISQGLQSLGFTDSITKANVNPNNQKTSDLYAELGITSNVIDSFKEFHAADYDLYDLASEVRSEN